MLRSALGGSYYQPLIVRRNSWGACFVSQDGTRGKSPPRVVKLGALCSMRPIQLGSSWFPLGRCFSLKCIINLGTPLPTDFLFKEVWDVNINLKPLGNCRAGVKGGGGRGGGARWPEIAQCPELQKNETGPGCLWEAPLILPKVYWMVVLSLLKPKLVWMSTEWLRSAFLCSMQNKMYSAQCQLNLKWLRNRSSCDIM